ncbi:protoporphyrinogen oxidase [Cellulomonas shaoxiangyii]|uniref:Coproporphyrinogen III oxidase n=1 Tax=Cellulomonas shaoxiangyii TaxID=2566013 RepID=A0A4P7SMI1_9CELL|nr:protoporphyrinogen oxidase [Cellulomonas shaoxiangyii]QCB95490.1 protoporphyrinogen oxidase [Cellulomonas shaoxiangyii]TGY77446.1 protoporphyrinogen oxidase [Cellulomonas shaoxiangyii]
MAWDVVVVGAGVAGLVAARDLVHAGRRVVLVDARDAPGGAVRGHDVAGLRLDAGAESFATRGGAVAALLAELGLAADVVAPEPHGAWVHLTSGDGPLPRTGLLGVPAHPLAADVRATLGTRGALRAALDLVLPARVGADATTLGALVRARMGDAVADRLVHPVVGGVHAADPDDLATDTVAPGLAAARAAAGGSLARGVRALRASAPAGTAVQGLTGGIHRLVDALVDDVTRHGGVVLTRTRATSLVRRADGGFVVRTEHVGAAAPGAAPDDGGCGASPAGGSGDLATARVLLATPQAPALLTGLGADLASVATDDGVPVTLVTLVVDSPALDAAPRGTGVLVGTDVTDVAAKALTHATAKWGWLRRAAPPGRHVVRLSYGRATAAHAADGTPPADALLDVALADASTLLGVPLTADALVGHAVVRWTQSLPRPSAAHREAVAAARAAVADVPGLAVCGAWAAGTGLASVVPDARAAAALLADLPPRAGARDAGAAHN